MRSGQTRPVSPLCSLQSTNLPNGQALVHPEVGILDILVDFPNLAHLRHFCHTLDEPKRNRRRELTLQNICQCFLQISPSCRPSVDCQGRLVQLGAPPPANLARATPLTFKSFFHGAPPKHRYGRCSPSPLPEGESCCEDQAGTYVTVELRGFRKGGFFRLASVHALRRVCVRPRRLTSGAFSAVIFDTTSHPSATCSKCYTDAKLSPDTHRKSSTNPSFQRRVT